MTGMAMGLHVCCGLEDNLWKPSRMKKASTVEQIEQLVRISREFGRPMSGLPRYRRLTIGRGSEARSIRLRVLHGQGLLLVSEHLADVDIQALFRCPRASRPNKFRVGLLTTGSD